MADIYPIPDNPQFKDLRGQRRGRLLILDYAGKIGPRKHSWNCLCDCGKRCVVASSNLNSGNTKSCGCLSVEKLRARVTTHGQAAGHPNSYTREYRSWRTMIVRCGKSSAKAAIYADRGIVVCERWRHSFVDFLADMGKAPSAKHSIDRINNDGNYEPGNCRWATQKQQCRNQRRNRLVTAWGETKVLAEWAEVKGVDYQRIVSGLDRGMSPEDAIDAAVLKSGSRRRS